MERIKSLRVFPNKMKFYSSLILAFFSILSVLAAQFLYLGCVIPTDGVTITGDPFLPEYYITYEVFSGDTFLSAAIVAVTFPFGIIAATFKKPYTAILFIIITALAGYFAQETSKKALLFP